MCERHHQLEGSGLSKNFYSDPFACFCFVFLFAFACFFVFAYYGRRGLIYVINPLCGARLRILQVLENFLKNEMPKLCVQKFIESRKSEKLYQAQDLDKYSLNFVKIE